MEARRAQVYMRNLNYRDNLQALLSRKIGTVDTFLEYVVAALNLTEGTLEVATSKRVQAIRFRQYGKRREKSGASSIESQVTDSRVTRET